MREATFLQQSEFVRVRVRVSGRVMVSTDSFALTVRQTAKYVLEQEHLMHVSIGFCLWKG